MDVRLFAHCLSAFDRPPETRELYIAADNDLSRTGIKAAETLARRAHAAGLTVKIWQPDKAGTDALDEWNARNRPRRRGHDRRPAMLRFMARTGGQRQIRR